MPETLHGLIAARLDGLSPDERLIVQDGAVLGKTFFKQGVAQVSGLTEQEVEPILSSLVRKEVLSLQADPRSPERGQYGFLQDLVRKVAYDTLSKKERKAKHLAAAAFIEEGWTGEEEEIVEVVASHYLSAYEAAPEAEDAKEIRDKAREHLVAAGERAASLAAPAEAQRYFEQAVGLADDAATRAELHERSGNAASIAARSEDAASHFERSIALFEGIGASHPAARVSARLAEVLWDRGRLEHGLEMMARSFEVLSREEPDADLAWLAAQLGRFTYFAGGVDLAVGRIETALQISEALRLPEVLSQALNTKGLILHSLGRPLEGFALLKYALDVALEYDSPSAALRAYYNVADLLPHSDRYQDAEAFDRDGLALARRFGSKTWEWSFLGHGYSRFCLGQWDEALELASELPEAEWVRARTAFTGYLATAVAIQVHRGALEEADRLLGVFGEYATSTEVQERAVHACGRANLLLARGDYPEAIRSAETALEGRQPLSITHEAIKGAFVAGVEAAFGAGDLEKMEDLLAIVEALPPGRRPQFLDAQLTRFRARLEAIEGAEERVESRFKGSAGAFREISVPFYLAVTLLEYGEWLVGRGRGDSAAPQLDEARGIFELLRAQPWLDRLERMSQASSSLR